VPTGSTHLPENWKATVAFRLGAEWKYTQKARVRFGFVYDPTPISAVDFSPAIPGNNRQLYCIGYGYDITPATTLDLGYSYVHINQRNQTQSPATPPGAPATVKNGVYKGDANIIMASVNTHF
jgi:long-chain fatty acid transport protein